MFGNDRPLTWTHQISKRCSAIPHRHCPRSAVLRILIPVCVCACLPSCLTHSLSSLQYLSRSGTTAHSGATVPINSRRISRTVVMRDGCCCHCHDHVTPQGKSDRYSVLTQASIQVRYSWQLDGADFGPQSALSTAPRLTVRRQTVPRHPSSHWCGRNS